MQRQRSNSRSERTGAPWCYMRSRYKFYEIRMVSVRDMEMAAHDPNQTAGKVPFPSCP